VGWRGLVAEIGFARPEVQEHLKAMLAAHYEDWEKKELPALGNQTPLEAVQTPGGRERVEALLVEIERRSAGLPVPHPIPPHFVAYESDSGS
jgi:Protein of unknown function (DUF2384)